MSDAELQEEEREVLFSIYDGDPAFKQLTPTTFQYKVQELTFASLQIISNIFIFLKNNVLIFIKTITFLRWMNQEFYFL